MLCKYQMFTEEYALQLLLKGNVLFFLCTGTWCVQDCSAIQLVTELIFYIDVCMMDVCIQC